MSRLLLADTIKNLCRKNERFLIELAESVLLDPYDEAIVENEIIEPAEENCFIEVYSLDECSVEPVESHLPGIDDHVEWNQLVELDQKSKDLKVKDKTGFFCTHCFAEFNTRAKCIYHEKMKHRPRNSQDVKRFTCDRCGMK